jgi:YHS domain-containing protein
MLKKIFIILSAIIFVSVITEFSFAMMCHGKDNQHSGPEAVAQATPKVDMKNKICPVSGEKIDEKLKAVYEYEGKIYNFCCQMCIDEFKKDPEKYIKKVEEELQQESLPEGHHH